VATCTRPMPFERSVRRRRIPWIQLKHALLCANLATSNATDEQLSAVRPELAHDSGFWAGAAL